LGFLKHVMFHLQYLFRLFVKCSAPLAICYKHLPRVNKGHLLLFFFIFIKVHMVDPASSGYWLVTPLEFKGGYP